MFGILEKKILLTDLLNNMVDMHNHILPSIDDGAQNINESIALIAEYQKLGINKIFATPHTMTDYYPNTNQSISKALELLKNNLVNSNLNEIEIKAASEYMIDPHFEELIDLQTPLLTFNNNHILVEMSYLRASDNLEEVLYKLQLKEYKPILAHPERYPYYFNDLSFFNSLKSKGIKLQLNLLSLSNHYGSKINKVALELLKKGLYDFIGTDTHKIRHLDKLKTIKIKSSLKNPILELIKNNKALF